MYVGGAGKVYLKYAVLCQSHLSSGSLYLQAEFSIFLEEYFVAFFLIKTKQDTLNMRA